MAEFRKIFKVEMKRSGDGRYNPNLSALVPEIEEDIDRLLLESRFLQSAPFNSIYLLVLFDDYDSGPQVHFIDRDSSQLVAECHVDWRNHDRDGRNELKLFFLGCVAKSLLYVGQEFSLNAEVIHRSLSEFGIAIPPIIESTPLKNARIYAVNSLELGVPVSDGEFGSEEERAFCQEIGHELSKFGGEFDETIGGGGFYCVFISCDRPKDLYVRAERFLESRHLPKGTYVEPRYLQDKYYERERIQLV